MFYTFVKETTTKRTKDSARGYVNEPEAYVYGGVRVGQHLWKQMFVTDTRRTIVFFFILLHFLLLERKDKFCIQCLSLSISINIDDVVKFLHFVADCMK